MRITNGALVGIGTTSPYARLTVWGPDTASSTAVFAVVNNASTTEFAVFDGGNAQLAGTLTQSSDARLKTNIQSLDASSSLSAIEKLNPVTYEWIDPAKGSAPQLGFIAQQVLPIFPNLVSTISPTALTPDGTLGLNYIGFIAPIVRAIQALDQEIANLASTVAGFAQSFTTHQLCISDGPSDQSPVCVTKPQLAALLSQSAAAGLANPTPSSSGTSVANPSPAGTPVRPRRDPTATERARQYRARKRDGRNVTGTGTPQRNVTHNVMRAVTGADGNVSDAASRLGFTPAGAAARLPSSKADLLAQGDPLPRPPKGHNWL